MIQHTNSRTSGPAAPFRQDGPEQWGQWSGRKHYSLEVVQHPLRARMCGFGDKDRRPLAPAAVAKMTVRREDNTSVDVDDIDCSFFLVLVDLWSEDGKQERNLVMHPSSVDRYVPPNSSRPRRRTTSTSAPHQHPSGHQTPIPQPPSTPSHYRPADQSSGYSGQSYYAPVPDSTNFPATPYASGPASSEPTWGYGSSDRNTSFPPPVLPSIHSFRNPSGQGGESWQSENESESLTYRGWNPDANYPPVTAFSNSQVDPALRHSGPDARDGLGWSQTGNPPNRYGHDAYAPGGPPNSQADGSIYVPTSYAQYAQPGSYVPAQYSSQVAQQPQQSNTSSGSSAPIPRHTYTRTLVGPLSANACRLLDEHRKPGIFFLFQDLSVRTEGTFRLRMRLMNVGAHPAPEAGAVRVHNDVSPVLAQVFTEPFTVFSAKRFPGVPDTTALSIAFGNQGQKLPLRNRHGNKRQRRDDSGSDDDTDEA